MMPYPRRRLVRRLIYVVCFLLVLVALDMLWARSLRAIHPRYDTTRITEPTLADGSIDYLAAIESYFSLGVTPENNAAPLFLEALGRQALPRTQPPDGITSRLGMAHLPEKGNYFVLYSDFTKARDGKSAQLPLDDANFLGFDGPKPPPPELSPTIAAWVEANQKPLALIRKASMRTRYFLPFDGGNRPEMLISILLPHVGPLYELNRALAFRVRMRLEHGDAAGARDDAMTLHRLSRLLSQAPTLVERSFATGIEARACDADRAIVSSGGLSPAALRAYASDLAALPDLDPPTPAIDVGERYMMLDATQRLARMSPFEAGRMYQAITNADTPPAWLFPFLPVPYEQSMVAANTWYDGLLAALRQPTYARRRDALSRWEAGVGHASTAGYLSVCSPAWALGLFMPSVTRFQTCWEIARCRGRLSEISLRLAAWKQEHGQYPPSLDDLAAPAAPPIPLDNFTDRPFFYSRTPAGFTLHTPGPNLIDDGGQGDDIGVNLK